MSAAGDALGVAVVHARDTPLGVGLWMPVSIVLTAADAEQHVVLASTRPRSSQPSQGASHMQTLRGGGSQGDGLDTSALPGCAAARRCQASRRWG